ncbi:hypothetical protein AVEN_13317-1 [Araneus ventricosus]|uniref:Uncharacterized protein n=1 Tax=Araneus ventricosus TaxID=182803 RepID=A0A4Y2IJY6_ARAVE|nr:hypothetical protein AVEN_13317-1 [Araneus ventricosus]
MSYSYYLDYHVRTSRYSSTPIGSYSTVLDLSVTPDDSHVQTGSYACSFPKQALQANSKRLLTLLHFTLRHTPDSRNKNLRFAVWMSVHRNFSEQKKKVTCSALTSSTKKYVIIKRSK